MSKTPKRTTIEQIMYCVEYVASDGTYYGPKKLFDKRTAEAMEWLRDLLREESK